MARPSQKSQFGPSKARIKPDSGNATGCETLDDNVDEDDAALNNDRQRYRQGKYDKPGDGASETPSGKSVGGQKAALGDEVQVAYTSEADDESPQTCCSSCHTVFEVARELLESSDTRVRCGECLSIFDALANLRESSRDRDATKRFATSGRAAAATSPPLVDEQELGNRVDPADDTQMEALTNSSLQLDVTYSDFALFSADAGLPELEYLSETREVPAFDFDELGDESDFDGSIDDSLYTNEVIEDERTASSGGVKVSDTTPARGDVNDSVTASRPSVVNAATNANAASDDSSAGLSDIEELLLALKKRELPVIVEEGVVAAWRVRGLLIVLVLILVVGLYGYRERASLKNSWLVRPALESMCSLIGCTVSGPVDLDALKITKRTVFSHPNIDDTLIINIGFMNQADFNQRFPTLEIRLTDRRGGLIVQHDYTPADYLDGWQPGDVLATGKSLDISINMEDPGNEAMSFELDFR